MKNANKPAMPQTVTDSSDGSGLIGSHMEDEWSGLTKLEYFALKIHCATISHHGKACFNASIDEAGQFLNELDK